MKTAVMKLSSGNLEIDLPDQTDILSMTIPEKIANPATAITESLGNPIGSRILSEITEEKLRSNPESRAVIVISDNTRPVPYLGERGILWPIVKILLERGVKKEKILILVATGTHRKLSRLELREMLDPRIFAAGIPIRNHDCRNQSELVFLGKTTRGSKMYVNRFYMEADLKILTGLVESHFMAGVSGGRKSVCPGIVGEESTYIFHGVDLLASSKARDLILDGNPCHQEALEVAKMVGVDFIVNVTLDWEFNLTGVFSGDLEAAHERAVAKIMEYVTIPVDKEYDLVVSHAGFVGINHYQAAKAGIVAAGILKHGGSLILTACNADSDPIGSPNYRTMLHLLKLLGPDRFNVLIRSPDWKFIPEQWQVQMWSKLFQKIPFDNFTYFSPFLSKRDYAILPGRDGNEYLPLDEQYPSTPDSIPKVVARAVDHEIKIRGKESDAKIAYLADGPYGIPCYSR